MTARRARRSATVAGLVAAVLTGTAGCGSQPGTQESAAQGGSCGGKTRVVKAIYGVTMTVPADWKVRSSNGGYTVSVSSPDSAVKGGLAVEITRQSISAAVASFTEGNPSFPHTRSDPVKLEGFTDARLLTGERKGNEAYVVIGVNGALTGTVVLGVRKSRVDDVGPTVRSCLTTVEG